MNFSILPNGNLSITANLSHPQDIDDLSSVSSIEDLIGSYFYNQLHIIQPEEIGALTGAPIVSDAKVRDLHGQVITGENLWWYPEYQMHDPLEVLMEKGEVIFTKA